MTNAQDQNPRPGAAAGGWSDDSGFTLIELMVSLFVVALVGTFAMSLQMATSSVARTEANRQIAAQLLARELDKVRGLGGLGAAAIEPDTTEQINGVDFAVARTVDTCWQLLSADGKTPTCLVGALLGSAEMAHVVITISWLERDKTYTQSGDVTINADPAFPA